MSAAAHSNPHAQAARLHSRYNPQQEAERYIDSLSLTPTIRYFILLEPGMGYLAAALKKCFPESKIIALHVDEQFRITQETGSGDFPAWFPSSTESVQAFLAKEIPDSPSPSIKIIEWRPSLDCYGKQYQQIFLEAVDFIKRCDATWRTSLSFGKRWIRNFFKNLSLVHTVLRYKQGDFNVIITGSGPSLEAALPKIAALRKTSFIIAASSSLQALRRSGVEPDLVISTDGGPWAMWHLQSMFRVTSKAPQTPALAANLCAALPSQCGTLPLLVLCDGSLWQTLIFNELGIPSVMIPQMGTVTASALELALILGRGNIYFAGMDLQVADIRSHARPYSFDNLFASSSLRLKPTYSQAFSRSRNIAGGKSLEIYAAWFRDKLKTLPKKIYTLGTENDIFSIAPASHFDQNAAKEFTATDFLAPMAAPGNSETFCARALDALNKGLQDSHYTQILSSELQPLLCPGENITAENLTQEMITKELERLKKRYGGHARG